MSYCPKCGAKITEEMSFCSKCGAPLKIEQAPPVPPPAPAPATTRREYRRHEKEEEKGEKHEKHEKKEKGEKGEKHEYGFLGPLVGGLILISLGATWWLSMTEAFDLRLLWALFLLMVGIVIILATVYGAFVLRKRHPVP